MDRLWPRGISKEKAQVEYWYKEIAPSSALRNQFHDGKTTYEQFKQLYVDELERNPEASLFVEGCRKWLETDCVTFLFGKKDEEQNNAVALRDWVTGKLKHNCF